MDLYVTKELLFTPIVNKKQLHDEHEAHEDEAYDEEKVESSVHVDNFSGIQLCELLFSRFHCALLVLYRAVEARTIRIVKSETG